MAGPHGDTVPTNGVRAKHDVMCADRFPLFAEDQRLLPLQHREPGATLPSRLGCLEETEWGEGSPCAAGRGHV